MSGTFACPHCGAQYPIKPVLVGRAVRCTTCKNPFRLRADGVADKVEEAPAKPATETVQKPATATVPVAKAAPQAPAPQATPEPKAPAPAAARPAAPAQEAPKAPAAAAAPVANTPPAAAAPAPGTERRTPTRQTRTGRVSREDHEAQRKALAADLATAANQALKAESVQRQEVKETKRKTDRLAAGGKAGKGSEGTVGAIAPAVLTGYGEAEHRNNMVWLIGSIGVIAGFIVLVMLLSMRSDQQKTIDAFTALVEGERSRYGERMIAIQERSLIGGVAAITDEGDLDFGSVRTIAMAPAAEPLATLQGRTWQSTYEVWATAEEVSRMQPSWDNKLERSANLKRLEQIGLHVVSQEALAKSLEDAGFGEAEVEMLQRLLTGQTDRTGENWIAEKLLGGSLPDAIEICPIHGKAGEMLVDQGRTYRHRKVDYEGELLRFSGAGWPDEWKVFTITAASGE
jgi:hypothetical protein